MRSGEHVVGTSKGVFKCSHLMRRSPDKRWSADLVKVIGGSPADPVPGAAGRRIPAFAKKYESEDKEKAVFIPKSDDAEVRSAYIYKTDVEEHGATPSCP